MLLRESYQVDNGLLWYPTISVLFVKPLLSSIFCILGEHESIEQRTQRSQHIWGSIFGIYPPQGL